MKVFIASKVSSYFLSLSFWVGHEGIWEFPWNISYKLFFPEVLWKKFLGRKSSTNLKLLFQKQLNSFTECPTLNLFLKNCSRNPLDISSDMPNIFNVQWAMVPFGINRWRFMPWANIQKHLFLLPSRIFCVQRRMHSEFRMYLSHTAFGKIERGPSFLK